MCTTLIEAGTMSCEGDFCASCSQAGLCDHSCELPCAGGSANGGHRRRLGESLTMFSVAFQPTDTCEWDTLDDTVRAIDAVCCAGGDSFGCAAGHLPETCSYDCGKVFVPFINRCGAKLALLGNDEATMAGYRAYQSLCLQLDPETMVLAIDRSVCVTCGDGEVSAEEDCDDGLDGNSDEPDAHCRLDCHLARCGDGIVDGGEECDLGGLDSDDATEEDQCMTDCTQPVLCPFSAGPAEFTTLGSTGAHGPTSTAGYG